MDDGASTLLTTDDVAERLQVPAETVRYWRHVGTGPDAVKVGRFVRYRPSDVAAWLDRQQQADALIRTVAVAEREAITRRTQQGCEARA